MTPSGRRTATRRIIQTAIVLFIKQQTLVPDVRCFSATSARDIRLADHVGVLEEWVALWSSRLAAAA
jgi:hypothetical protein